MCRNIAQLPKNAVWVGLNKRNASFWGHFMGRQRLEHRYSLGFHSYQHFHILILTLVYRSWQKIPSWCYRCRQVTSNPQDQSWQMVPKLIENVIVLHHNGVSLWSMASSNCGVAKEKGLFCSHFDICTDTVCQKITPVLNIFCKKKCLLNFVLSDLLWSGQAWLSKGLLFCVNKKGFGSIFHFYIIVILYTKKIMFLLKWKIFAETFLSSSAIHLTTKIEIKHSNWVWTMDMNVSQVSLLWIIKKTNRIVLQG